MRSDQKALADIYYRIITESKGRKVIEGDVYLNNLYLKELPEWLSDVEVKGRFYCRNNKLTTLQGAPKTVGGDFSCSFNKLTTLAGAPKIVKGSFFCHANKLTTLAGAPETVGDSFYCNDNKLTTLQGGPKTLGGSFSCSDNKLTTLAGAPETLGGGSFFCSGNPGNFTEEDVRAVSNVTGLVDV
jgi:hypothetical protein